MELLEAPAALENRPDSWKRRRQNNKVKKTTVIEDLSHEILTDIFLRLPIESIIRAKFTCKLWFAIISDPLFTRIHRDRAIGNPGYLYRFCNRGESPAAIICFAETVGGQVHGMKFLFEPVGYCKSPFGFTSTYASTGCLLALYPKKEDCYYVCNPVIHEKVRVPLDPPDFNSQDSEQQQHAIWWAFGFSSSTGVYKIIHFSFPWIGNPPCYLDIEHRGQGSTYTLGSSIGNQGQGAIYTLGSSTEWKRIQNVPFRPRDKRYIDCDGTLIYCLDEEENKRNLIGTFDILSEEFQACQGPLPPNDEIFAKSRDYYLIKMEDTVSFVHTDHSCGRTSIWTLRDKVKDFWIKEYALIVGCYTDHNLGFIGVWMGRNLFGFQQYPWVNRYYAYDDSSKEFKLITLPYMTEEDAVLIFPHVGTLISPKLVMASSNAS